MTEVFESIKKRLEADYCTDQAKAVYWDGRNSVGEAVASGAISII